MQNRILLPLVFLFVIVLPAHAQVLFQQFYYPIDSPADGLSWWQQSEKQLPALAQLGVSAVWHPVPTKGGSGANSMGYDPYDPYDLGSKNQKGTVATRFGTKAQYLAYIAAAHANGLRVYSDVVMNHAGGADFAEENPIMARLGMDDIPDDSKIPAANRPANLAPNANLRSWTRFQPVNAQGERGKGRFPRDYRNFHPSKTHPDRSKPYHEKEFEQDYCFEAEGGYVAKHLDAWGVWFRNQTGVDGYRLDAVKIIEPTFLDGFANAVKAQKVSATGNDFFLVGEFWDTNQTLLSNFQTATHHLMSLFDFGLFYALWDMTEKPANFDMHILLSKRLQDRDHAVSFVSNHDVDRFQPIQRLKRALPYAITMAMAGRPSIFYKDYFQPEDKNLPRVLENLTMIHNRFAVGKEIVRFVDTNLLVIEREKNLLAVFNSGGSGAARTITVPTDFGANVALRDSGNLNTTNASVLRTAQDGSATVTVPAGGYLLLTRSDATSRTNPNRFALHPLATTQITEFADDLDTGKLNPTPQEIPLSLAADTPLNVRLTTQTMGIARLELLDADGKTVAKAEGNATKKPLTLRLRHVPKSGLYHLRAMASAATDGSVSITYTASVGG